MSGRLAAYERQLFAAFRAVSNELERMLRDEVIRTARRNPGKTVTAVSAMGAWFLHVDDEERNPPVFRTFERVQGEYGWGAIPAPVLYETKDGGATLIRLTEWGVRPDARTERTEAQP